MNPFPHAAFIWIRRKDRTPNRYLAFHRAFRLSSPPAAGTLRISAYAHYQVAVNGVLLGRGPDPSNHRYYFYDAYDVATVLKRGVNTIRILAYAFGAGLPWPETSYLPGESGWLIFELACRHGRNKTRIVASDASCRVRIADAWQQKTSGYTELRAGYKEYYDGGKLGYDALAPSAATGKAWTRAAELAPGDMTYTYAFREKEIKPFRHPKRHPATAYCIDGGFAYGFTKTRGWQVENPGALVPGYPVNAYYDVVRKGEPDFPRRRVEADAENACVVHHSHFEDCPWREQKLYLGDMHLEALGCYYSWGEYAYVAKNLKQLAARNREDGWIRSGPGFSLGEGGLIDFPIYFPIELRDHALYSGDLKTLKALYPHAVRVLDNYMDMGVRNNGLLDIGKADTFQNWCFINWNEIVKKGQCAALNFLFARGLAAGAEMADWLDRPDEASCFRRTLSSLLKAIDKAFWNPDAGLYIDSRFKGEAIEHYSAETNTLALLSGLPAVRKKRCIIKALTSGRLAPETPTAFFNAYVAEGLLLNRKTAPALELIEHYWGMMLDRGTDAFWEIFLPQTPGPCHPPKGTSLCHGFSSGPAYLLPAYILGIRPLEPGFRRFTVDPQLSGLDHVSGAIPTPLGYIDVTYDQRRLRIRHPKAFKPVIAKGLRLPKSLHVDLRAG